MSLTNSQYNSIQRIYDEKQKRHRLELENHINYVNQNISGFLELNNAISSLCVQQAKKILSDDNEAALLLKDKILDMKKEKAALLKASNIEETYLQMQYDCPDCKDTGYQNGQKCHCFKQAMLSILYDQSGIKDMLMQLDFNKISEHYYQGKDYDNFVDTLKITKDFVKNFKKDYQNLIFYGTVGTGKSLMSGCIDKSLIESGHSVIYFSASSLIDALSKYTFDYKSKEEQTDLYSDIYECDLLIIDDLGTEMTNAFSVSKLFTCLNERFLRKKSIVISTNLSLEELRDRYSDRIFSRITGNFTFCRLTGPDIRMLQ